MQIGLFQGKLEDGCFSDCFFTLHWALEEQPWWVFVNPLRTVCLFTMFLWWVTAASPDGFQSWAFWASASRQEPSKLGHYIRGPNFSLLRQKLRGFLLHPAAYCMALCCWWGLWWECVLAFPAHFDVGDMSIFSFADVSVLLSWV